MTTKTTFFLEPEAIRRKLNELGDIALPERAKFVCGIVFILDESGELYLRHLMQGEISIEKLTNCQYNVTRKVMKSFLESCVSAEETMQ